MSQAVLPHFIERGFGRIVMISSYVGQVGRFGQANYAAAKSGQFGLTKALALETAAKGITVNCVVPGAIKTDMVSALPEDIVQAVPDARPGHARRRGGGRPVPGLGRGALPHRRAHPGGRGPADDVSSLAAGNAIARPGGFCPPRSAAIAPVRPPIAEIRHARFPRSARQRWTGSAL